MTRPQIDQISGKTVCPGLPWRQARSWQVYICIIVDDYSRCALAVVAGLSATTQ